MKKQWAFLLTVGVAAGLIGCSGPKKNENDITSSQSQVSETIAGTEETGYDNPSADMIQKAMQPDDTNRQFPPLVTTEIDLQEINPELCEEASVQKVTLPLPEGWTLQAYRVPYEHENMLDYYIPIMNTTDVFAAFDLLDETGTRCGAFAVTLHPSLEDIESGYFQGNNIHFSAERTDMESSRTDDYETYIGLVEHWENGEGRCFNDGVLWKNPNTFLTMSIEIELDRVSNEQLNQIADQTTLME